MHEIRCNLITGDWVIFATERAKRPEDFNHTSEKREISSWVESCPFCPGNEHFTPDERLRLYDSEQKWSVRSVPNKFSVLSVEGSITRQIEGLKHRMSGVGLHEVLIETPFHHLTTAVLPIGQIEQILSAYRQRFLEFYKDSRISHVIIFKNHGVEAGTSLEHPHSQIVGTPVIPGQVRARIDEASHLYHEFEKCLYCRTLTDELEDQIRLVEQNDSFVAFIPYAALSPFHLWIFPRRHEACFGHLQDHELKALAQILKNVLARVYIGLDNPPFNYVIRSLPPSESKTKFFHWYVAIVPRVSKLAGFELGTGMYINTTLPEKSAQFLREINIDHLSP